MDIDSAASTPILQVAPDLSNAQYLRYELTALAYHLKEQGSGLGAGRAGTAGSEPGAAEPPARRIHGARHRPRRRTRSRVGAGVRRARVDGVEINPIIANDVMRDRFQRLLGRHLHASHASAIVVDDGRSFVRRTPERYDVIQASLVDTWAATAAGAYTLTENTLYTVEAFNDYLDHLTDDGVLTITRWVFDGLRLVSLAQEACDARGWNARSHAWRSCSTDRVATFLLKKSPFTAGRDRAAARGRADVSGSTCSMRRIDRRGRRGWRRHERIRADEDVARRGDYARLIMAADREAVLRRATAQDIRPTTDDRPFFFHTTKLARSVRRRVRPVDAVRQRPERAADADGHLRRRWSLLFVLGPLLLTRAAARAAAGWLRVARLLRRARRRLHADRSRGAAAVRAAARPPGLLADGDAVLAAARHRPRRGVEPPVSTTDRLPRTRQRSPSRRSRCWRCAGDRRR